MKRRLDLDTPDAMADLAAVGIAKLAWRNSPVEDWHSVRYRRIGQSEMMRANAATTRLVRDILVSQLPVRHGPAEDARSAGIGAAALFGRIHVAVANPQRRLPDGRTVAELAPGRNQFDLFCREVRDHCHGWALQAGHVGLGAVLRALMGEAGRGSCRRWWLGPDWPAVVAEFVLRLEEPKRWEDPLMAELVSRAERPDDLPDREQLRHLLLTGPDQLTADLARYCLQAGLGAIHPHWWDPPGHSRDTVAGRDA